MNSDKLSAAEAGIVNKDNLLRFEQSPYLLQHADNPINWRAWNDESLAKAKREDKPIFLSIGYSSCHWCHVMEHESFEDEEVASLLNRGYVGIKVDREERPDIDNIYMSVCQTLTGSGGWPLTIIMTPDGKPFFAGTYFPKYTAYGRPGLIDILKQVSDLWNNDRESLLEATDRIVDAVKKNYLLSEPESLPDLTDLDEAFQIFEERYDKTHGGFGSAPKFPTPNNLSLLMRIWYRNREPEALKMVENSLEKMHRGGIFDHLGYGFHRYSTDQRWLVPHFEKMLYDQALLAIAYTEAFQITGKLHFREAAEQIFTYVYRDMTSPEGGFYSAEDADSEGEEGKFYVWSKKEISEILGREIGGKFCNYYGVTEMGNFEGGKSILHTTKSLEEYAFESGSGFEKLKSDFADSRKKLFTAREKRIHPFKDDKILADWNGLMIAALAKGSSAFNEPKYAEAASKAADFILREMTDERGGLLHRYRNGEAGIPGYLDDYSFMTMGLMELYESTFRLDYLKKAIELSDLMLELFGDETGGGLFFTGRDNKDLIIRTKEVYDGAVPSGNSVAALNLLKLGHLTANVKFEEAGMRILASFGEKVKQYPAGFAQFMIAVDYSIGPVKEIVVSGQKERDDTKAFLREIYRRFIPRKVLVLNPGGEEGESIQSLVPYIEHQGMAAGKPTVYLCENYECNLPATDILTLISLLE